MGRERERTGKKEREENGFQKGMRRNEATSDMAEGVGRKRFDCSSDHRP